jgi:hypothetical protein
MTIDASGNVGIGTDAPITALTVADTGPPEIAIRRNAIGSNNGSIGALTFGAYATGTTYGVGATILGIGKGNWSAANQGSELVFKTTELNSTSDTERMRIDSSGNLLVGRTSTASAATDYGTQVYSNGVIYQFAGATGSSDVYRWHNSAGTKIAYMQANGNLVITGTYSPSDERLKENIVDAPAGNLDDLKVRSYDWKADGTSVTHGLIAQELEVVAPYAVTKGETDDDMMAVDYSKLVPMLVKEIQDLKAEVAALKGA